MKILITGGAGYIGSVLVPSLIARGHRVRVFDKLVFGADGLAPVRDRIELVTGDIRAIESTVLGGIDAVIHLAGLSNDPTAEFDPKANYDINAVGTIRLAQQCKAAGVRRFVFGSSCSIYYTLEPDDSERDETSAVAPRAPYSFSKYEAEKGLLQLKDSQFCPVLLRKGTVFGPSPRMRYDLVVNTFTKDAFTNRRLIVHAGGRMWRPMLHIQDAVDAYIAAVEAPDEMVAPAIFNVLSRNIQVRQIAHEVRRAIELARGFSLDVELQQVGAARSYRVSSARFEKTFGLSLARDIGSAAVGMWTLLEAGDDPNDPIFYNIRWLELLESMRARLAEMGGSPL